MWHGSGGCGAKRKGIAAAAGRVGSMYCIAGDPDPALHSQLGKTDGEVTKLVSCDTSVLYTRSPHGRSVSWGATFLATGTCNPGGVIFGHYPGVARWILVLAAMGTRAAGGTSMCLSAESVL